MTHKFEPCHYGSPICSKCMAPESCHEKEVTVERPDEEIEKEQRSIEARLVFDTSDAGVIAAKKIMAWLEHVEAKLKELEAEHAQCPREVSGNEVDESMEWWTISGEWAQAYPLVPVPALSQKYIVRPRKTQTAEQKFRDALADEGLSDQSMERLIAAARKAGLLREES